MNKPVAWINLEAWLSGECFPDDCFGDEEFTGSIPLYTHPVKELTDEEIDSGISDIVKAIGLNADGLDDEDFARGIEVFKAILRKAQEK